MITNSISAKHTVVGTPRYMSPQVIGFEKYSPKADVWALGLIFYEMLYNTVPWNAASVSLLK